MIHVPSMAGHWVNLMTAYLTQWFGNTNRTDSIGTYVNPYINGGVVEEPIILIQAFASEMAYQQHRHEVYDLARRISAALGQDIAVNDCGQLTYVDRNHSLALAA